MNYKIVSYFLGWTLMVEAIAMVPGCLIALILKEETWPYFLPAIGICVLVFCIFSRKKNRTGVFFVREGYAATGLGWFLMSLIGALPFFLSGRIPNYVDAVFETASGLTTTGASILNDVEALGKGLLFWRSFSHWIGGMGVLVLVLAILPMNGGYHMQFMKAESPGHSVSKLVPRVNETARIMYLIYIGLTLTAIVFYLIGGMPLFDAVCIGVGTAGTGGFAVRNTGMADYSNLAQSFITLFMILFGVNFNAYYLIVSKKWKDALKSQEVRAYILFIVIMILVLTGIVWRTNYQQEGFYYSLHHAAFTTGSLVSSTGFGTVDFAQWPEFAQGLVLLIMFSGACSGSTGGGFKVSRWVILIQEIKNELHMVIHPSSVRTVVFEGKAVDHNTQRSLKNYFIIYFFFFLVSVIILSIDGFDFKTNFSAVLANLNNIGPGLSLVGPTSNFSAYSMLSKIVLIVDMIAGRLELLPVLMLVYRRTWSKQY